MLRSLYRGLYSLDRGFWSLATRLYLQVLGVDVGQDLRSIGLPIVRRSNKARIRLGHHVSVVNCNRGNPIGFNHPCIVVASEEAIVEVGADTGLSGAVINARKQVLIGSHVLVGANAKIFDHDFHPLDWRARKGPAASPALAIPVVIEDDAFIGTGALILKGASIGQGAIIGAGAIVTRSVSPFTVWAGNPARQVSSLDAFGSSVEPSGNR